MGESAISVRQRESYKETSSGTRGDCIVRDATLLLKTSRMEWEFVSSVSRTNRFRFFPRGSMRGYARFCHNIGNGLWVPFITIMLVGYGEIVLHANREVADV